MTYGGYGCLKRGVHAEDHAVVYTSRSLGPYFLDNEGITKPSIRVELTEPKESLEPLSRINYAKIYTVEHNVKVKLAFLRTMFPTSEFKCVGCCCVLETVA